MKNREEPFRRAHDAANREKKSRVWFGEGDVDVLNALNRIERDTLLVLGYLVTLPVKREPGPEADYGTQPPEVP